MKHTQGKWEISKRTPKAINIIGRSKTICNIRQDGRSGFKSLILQEEAEANAKLIAAAPELLEALNLIVNRAGSLQGLNQGFYAISEEVLKESKEIIKKATS